MQTQKGSFGIPEDILREINRSKQQESTGSGSFSLPKEEVEEWLAKDPIKRFKAMLLHTNASIDRLEIEMQKIEREVLAEIEEAVKFAVESPYPSPEEALNDVYA